MATQSRRFYSKAVRVTPQMLEEIKKRAARDDRNVAQTTKRLLEAGMRAEREEQARRSAE